MQLGKEIKKEKNAKISIQVTVDKSSVVEARETVIKDYEKTAKLPGFRKGKIPRTIILQRFTQNIKNETVNAVLSQSLSQILKESNYTPISEPIITEIGELSPDEKFSFKAEYDILPEVKLSAYKDISSEKYIYDVNEKIVKREIEHLRERFATLRSVDEKSVEGDYIVLDYEEFADEGKLIETKKEQLILLDKKDNHLTKHLIGLGKGDEKEIELEQENNADDEKQNSHKVKLHVSIKEVKKKELPELNDDFAKDVSDVESFKELKEKVKADIEEQSLRQAEGKTKDELMKKIIEKTEYDIPETMTEAEIDRILSDIVYSYKIDIKKLQKDKKKYNEYRNNLRPRAINNLKYELALNEVAKKENITVSKKEVDEEIKKYAQSRKSDFNALKKQLDENRSTESISYRLKISKALDFVLKNAKFDKEKHLQYGGGEENN